jgi:hypothetical protein
VRSTSGSTKHTVRPAEKHNRLFRRFEPSETRA